MPKNIVLKARNLKKDYYSIYRTDSTLALRFAYATLGWAGVLRNSPKLFHPKAILRGVSLDVYQNEILAITGKSGAGKSTLLHCLGAFDVPTSGEILFNGQSLKDMSSSELSDFRNNHIGYIFQFYHLYQDLNAFENVVLPARICADFTSKKAHFKERALMLLDRVGLKDRMKHRPNQLSGGEQQRVAIARALLLEPSILLCDEPTGNLDSETSESVLKLLFELKQAEERSYVIVTHDNDLADLSDRHLAMKDGLIVTERSNAKSTEEVADGIATPETPQQDPKAADEEAKTPA